MLLSLYRTFCAPLSYCFLREKEDFDFYKAVNAPFGENYALLDLGKSGFCSPDEYIPLRYEKEAQVLPGVMARVVDPTAAAKLRGLDLTGYSVVDPLRDADLSVPDGKKRIGIQELTEKIFSAGEGYLADRY